MGGNLNMETFTDSRDRQTYKTVDLRDGNCWFAENLRFAADGSVLADKNPPERILEKYPDYNYNWEKYGRLYTWEEAQLAAPPGWKIPSVKDYNKLFSIYSASSSNTFTELENAGCPLARGGFYYKGHYRYFNAMTEVLLWTSTESANLFQKIGLSKPSSSAKIIANSVVHSEHKVWKMPARCIRV